VIALVIQSIGGAQAAVAMKNGTPATAAGHITVHTPALLYKLIVRYRVLLFRHSATWHSHSWR
jgi:hypothetical protein